MYPLKPYLLIVLLFSCLPQASKAQSQRSDTTCRNQKAIRPWSSRDLDSIYKLDLVLTGRRSLSASNKPISFVTKQETNSKQSIKYSQQFFAQPKFQPQASSRTNSVCYVISGRDFLRQDSLILWTRDPSSLPDGNFIVSGEFSDYSVSPLWNEGGFCMKTDSVGNVIWTKLYDSVGNVTYDYLNCFKSIPLHDGSILLAGRTTNHISGNDDFVLIKIDNNGNIIWFKTYQSRFWQGFNGSGDFFPLADLKEDVATGSIYFVGNLLGGMSVVTKVDPIDGHIIWSNGYDTGDTDWPFGIIINSDKLLLFDLGNGYYNESYINVTGIDKTSGDTLFNKSLHQTGDLSAARLYHGFEVVKLNNGHFRMSGPTTRYLEYPTYTGTIDLFHAAIIELDENFNFVTAFGFKNRIEANGYNTKISMYPDGSGVFTMFDYISSYTGEAQVCLFQNDLIYHQRKRLHYNEGIPYEPLTFKLPDGGFLNIKLMGDSSVPATNGSRIDFYRLHTSDTASVCMGLKDSSTSIWYFNFEPTSNRFASIIPNTFSASLPKTYTAFNFETTRTPTCTMTSNCDTLVLQASATVICPGMDVTINIHKNEGCGSAVPFEYDTNFVSHVTRINDSTFIFHFTHPGSGYIYGSIMGCSLHMDSVFIQVISVASSLNLGADTVLCPGNQIILNAGAGFVSYLWQDGSTDSIFHVTSPGTYHVQAMNACGYIFRDTISVSPHPPIAFDVGPDRTKCNLDTLHLNAPNGLINYTWSPSYNINSATSQNVIVNPTVDTSYFIHAEKDPGCFVYDTVHVVVYNSPPINLGIDTSICFGDSLVLNAGVGFIQYQWNTGFTAQQLTAFNIGSYSVLATTSLGCKSSDTMKILSVYSLPTVVLNPDSTICEQSLRILDAGNGFTNYLWNTGSSNRTITVSGTGIYSVVVTDQHGCRSGDTTIINTLLPLPTAFLPADTSICSYGKLQLTALRNFTTYLWSTNSTSSSIIINQPGTFWLQVKDNHNCVGRDTIIVNAKQCLKGLYVPTAFTPNRDGKNDLLKPLLFGDVAQFEFAIYNRWGQKIFETKQLDRGWDGKISGIEQDSNVFIWICKYQFQGEEIKIEKGSFVLIR